jgi:glycosyltransferase involved in cell wall biosynthesis
MRILIVNTRHFYGGGDSTYSFNLADLLSKRGHEIAFFAMQDERNLADPNAGLFVSHIDYSKLNQHKNLVNGLKVLTRTIYSPEARRNFATLIDRYSPDMIHLHNFLGHITISILFEARKRNLPVVWTLHDYYLACPNALFLIDRTGEICEACKAGHFYHAILRQCKKDSWLASAMAAFVAYYNRWMGILKQVDAFLSPSYFLKNKLIEHGIDQNLIHHHPLFVPDGHFWEGDSNLGYILFLGKIELCKGIEVLIEAANKVKNVPILIAGRIGESFTSRLPGILPSNTQYVGVKHGQELSELTHNAQAIVLPSICYENQPFSILEAFASGKPVIASDLGGMKELVVHNERGLLVKPNDPSALAESLYWAFTHKVEMKEMGIKARQYALENHNQEKHYQTLMNIYSKVCSARNL